MNILHKLASSLTATILTIALLLLGVALAITGTFSSPQPVKDALSRSGAYKAFIIDVVDDAGGDIEEFTHTDPAIRPVIADAALPYMQKDMEKGIDSLFAWLKDSSKPVNFTIKAAVARDAVASAVSTYVQKHIDSLPACSGTQAGPMDPRNPLSWTCTPAFATVTPYGEIVKTRVANAAFWDETTFTLDDIAGVSEEELTTDYRVIASVYQAAGVTVWISSLVIILCIAATWFLTRDVRRTLRRSGISFIIAGVALIAAAITVTILSGVMMDEFSGNDPMDAAIGDIVGGSLSGIFTWCLWSGIVATVLGIAALIATIFIKKTPTEPLASGPTNTIETPPQPQL